MQKISREDLLSLERYAELRTDFRARVMQHKKNRRLEIGPNVALYFEDRLTIQYQIQEMLRIEKIFEGAAIEEELKVYNSLVPGGRNWKATMMIEYGDPKERAKHLARLMGIEDKVWLCINGLERISPIADEDLERTTEEKTSAVHFLRFELTEDMVVALKQGAPMQAGVEHSNYNHRLEQVPDHIRESLLADLD